MSETINKGDLISRQAVLNGIAEWIADGYADSVADCSHISSLVSHLPPAENKSEWIPTIERLPEVGDTVLCSVKTPECTDHHIIICKYCAEAFWKDGTIRAWQPLPEPYEEETKDWVDREMAKKYGFVLREEDRLKIRTSGAEFLEEVGGEIGSSCEKFIRQMTGNEGGKEC